MYVWYVWIVLYCILCELFFIPLSIHPQRAAELSRGSQQAAASVVPQPTAVLRGADTQTDRTHHSARGEGAAREGTLTYLQTKEEQT